MIDFSAFTSALEEADVITIFRHIHPDCDALGSQFGLLTWIEENYPEKKVYALGYETTDQAPFPASDKVSDEVIQNSLAVVLDTSDRPRIDDQRFASARKLVKIDHHPDVDHYGDVAIVHPEYAAACEILGEYFQSRKDKKVSITAASYLYAGLLTDTLSYSTTNTTSHTLAIGSYLASTGIQIPEINRMLFDKSLENFRFGSYIRSKIEIHHDCIAVVILSIEEENAWHVDGPKARTYVTEMGHVKEFEAWAIFTAKKEGEATVYDGSLRSKHVAVNEIAAQYHGGGHKNASGVKNLSRQDIDGLIEKIYQSIDQK